MLRAVSRVVLIVGFAALGAAGAVAWRADLLVGYGLSRALEAQEAALPFELAATTAAGGLHGAEVGDEGYWLTRSSLEGQAPFDRHLAVGNRITVSGAHGHTRTLEVVEIAPLGAPLLKVAEDGPAGPARARDGARGGRSGGRRRGAGAFLRGGGQAQAHPPAGGGPAGRAGRERRPACPPTYSTTRCRTSAPRTALSGTPRSKVTSRPSFLTASASKYTSVI